MKNKDLKKGRESIIGKIIYGFLLFMPLLAILVTCGYAMFNKNAYKSYSDVMVEENKQITSLDEFNSELTYSIFSTDLNQNASATLPLTYMSLTYTDLGITEANYNNISKWKLRGNGQIGFYNSNDSYITALNFTESSTIKNFNFRGQIDEQFFQYNIYINIYTSQKIDNVFYYSVDKVEQSNLFNWAENSIIYTGIYNTCTQLSITNTFIPLLLAYWLIISVIYILYDIILMILIVLHNRVHRLQDSMS